MSDDVRVRLTDDEREALSTQHFPWHYTGAGMQCCCGEPIVTDNDECRSLLELYEDVERIVTERMAQAWDEGYVAGGRRASNPYRSAPTMPPGREQGASGTSVRRDAERRSDREYGGDRP